MLRSFPCLVLAVTLVLAGCGGGGSSSSGGGLSAPVFPEIGLTGPIDPDASHDPAIPIDIAPVPPHFAAVTRRETDGLKGVPLELMAGSSAGVLRDHPEYAVESSQHARLVVDTVKLNIATYHATRSYSSQYSSLTSAEKWLLATHPWRIKPTHETADAAWDYTRNIFANEKDDEEPWNDGISDAFRHSYWNMLLAQRCGQDWAETYATAHESDPENGGNRKAMDLHNNKVGRAIQASRPDVYGELALLTLWIDYIQDHGFVKFGQPSDIGDTQSLVYFRDETTILRKAGARVGPVVGSR